MFRVTVGPYAHSERPGVCYSVNLYGYRSEGWDLCGFLLLTQLEWEQWLRMCEAFRIEVSTRERVPAEVTEISAAR